MINSILYLYPNAKSLIDFTLQDDGAGAYIAKWDTDKLGPQPTLADLAAVANAAIATKDKAENNASVQEQIEAIEKQQIRAIREALLNKPGAVARLQAFEDSIVALRAKFK